MMPHATDARTPSAEPQQTRRGRVPPTDVSCRHCRRHVPITMIALTAALTLALGATAVSAKAATISLAVSADPAEEQALTITASGTADAPNAVTVSIRAAGGAPCAATDATESGSEILDRNVPAGPYAPSATYTAQAPGDYLLCGYLGSSSSAPPAAATSKTITVRANRATLAITAPPTAIPDQPVVFTFQGATEVSRSLFATIKPAGGTACGSAYSTDVGGRDVVFSTSIQGAYSVPRSQSLTAGAYLLCSWVQEGSDDLAPDAVASVVISVQPPDADGDGVPDATDRCPAQPGPGQSTGCPPRAAPAAFTATVRPHRDRRAPYAFRFSGRLSLPAGVTAPTACKGNVSVQIKRGTKTISTRHPFVRSDCTWVSNVRFANRSRMGRTGRLKVSVRFQGNDVLSPRGAPVLRIRAG